MLTTGAAPNLARADLRSGGCSSQLKCAARSPRVARHAGPRNWADGGTGTWQLLAVGVGVPGAWRRAVAAFITVCVQRAGQCGGASARPAAAGRRCSARAPGRAVHPPVQAKGQQSTVPSITTMFIVKIALHNTLASMNKYTFLKWVRTRTKISHSNR